MAILSLALTFAWIGLVAGVPVYLRRRRSGEIRLATLVRRGSAQWWARSISVIGFVLAIAAPLAAAAGLSPIEGLDRFEVRVIGGVLWVLGIIVTLIAQAAMGDSWRADVEPGAHTRLVTTGPFRVVRNPIFTGTAITAIGLALLVANVLAVAMLVCFMAAWEIQVRLVEEPYLRDVHGDAYRRYAARTGRFILWIGRLRA